MKMPSSLKLFTLVFGFAGLAYASPMTWTTQTTNPPLKLLTESSPTYTGLFDLTTVGYDPGTMEITSAVASFAFADDASGGDASSYHGGDSEEYVDVFIDNLLLIDNQEVDGTYNSPPSSYAWDDSALNANMLLALEDDGKISYKVQLLNTSGSNDTYLKIAKLEAHGNVQDAPPPPPTSSVPDQGATSVLLLAGLAGLAALRKRFRSAA
jgi:hypothetical protein